jgi:HEPN domain-containing protein
MYLGGFLKFRCYTLYSLEILQGLYMEAFLKQLSELITEYESLCESSGQDDLSDLEDRELINYYTRARAAIHRISRPHDIYTKHCEEIFRLGGYPGYLVTQIIGVIDSLYDDMNNGYLQSQAELIHGELFSDFIEMSEHLLEEGYKDAAAVIMGSALEVHIKKLCEKNEIDILNDNGKHKKADTLNTELAKNGIYTKIEQKSITAWLGLRNSAAHGDYAEYSASEVKHTISAVRDFIVRHPA